MTPLTASELTRDCLTSSAHGQLLFGLRQRIRSHPVLAPLWAEWPGSAGLSLASLESRPWSSATFSGERHRLELRLRSRPQTPADTLAQVNVLIRHLDDVQLPISGHALIDFHFATARTEASPDDGADCLICFDALTLADPPLAEDTDCGKNVAQI